MGHKWVSWLQNPYHLGGGRHFKARGRIRGDPQVGKVVHNPCRLGGPDRFRAGDIVRGAPQVGKMAT